MGDKRKTYKLDVRGSVHHNTIHKEKSNKMQHCIKILLLHIYMKLNAIPQLAEGIMADL
jgi:hypothetical protein